jgi:hypothetical protein
MASSQVSAKVAIAAALRAAEASFAKTKAAFDAATREHASKATLAKLTKAAEAAESSVSELRGTQDLSQPTRSTAANRADEQAKPKQQEPILVKRPGTIAGVRAPSRFGRKP